MKTPEEIKRGLERCVDECDGDSKCPYDGTFGCDETLRRDALAYIRQLEWEKDALLEMAPKDCCYCKHYFNENADSPCVECTTKNPLWEWRGVEEDNHG